jgi:hypothetical protein
MAVTFSRLILLGIGLTSAACLSAKDPELDSLLRNSPFGVTAGTAKNGSNTPLEFRGVMVNGGAYYFSIYESATSRSTWVRLNDKSAKDFVAKNYDAQNKQLTLDYQGGNLTLALASAPSVPAPSAPRPAINPVPAGVSAAHAPGSENEAERLCKIADEIRRRRALRQEAISNTKSRQ